MSSPQALLPGHAGAPRFAGDFTLMRSDGYRIVVELCATMKAEYVQEKLRTWASWFAGTGMGSSNMSVILLNAEPRAHRSRGECMRRWHEEVIRSNDTAPSLAAAMAARNDDFVRHGNGALASGREVERAARQILLASWEDWFPAPRAIALPGVAARCDIRIEGRWHSVDAADPTSLPAPRYQLGGSARLPTSTWYATPGWLGDLPLHS